MSLDARNILRQVRRRANQLLGRDVKFRPQVDVPKARFGTVYGGWTIQPELIGERSIIYSVGVGNDISFDLALIDRYGCVVHAFDPTPKSIKWIAEQSLPPQFRFHAVGLADYDGVARFVLPRSDYVSFHIGEEQQGEIAECPVNRLSTLMQSLGHSHIDLLKMDIEGAEYSVIEDLLAGDVRPRQLMIEFHHVVGDRPSLERTRRAIDLLIASGYRIFDVSPVGMEYSFLEGNSVEVQVTRGATRILNPPPPAGSSQTASTSHDTDAR